MAAALEPDYESTLIDGNLDRDAVARGRDAVRAQRRIRRRRHHGHGRPAGRDGNRDVARAACGAIPDCPSSGAATFRRCTPTVALNSDYVDYVVRGQGEDTLRELLEALRARARARSTRIAGLSWRRDGGRGAAIRERGFSARAHRARAALRPAARPARLSREDFSRRAHRRAPGGARLPLPLHVLRRRGHVSRRHGVAAGRSASTASSRSSSSRSAPTRSSSTITISSTAKWTWCRCSRCSRATSCRGGVTRAPTRW